MLLWFTATQACDDFCIFGEASVFESLVENEVFLFHWWGQERRTEDPDNQLPDYDRRQWEQGFHKDIHRLSFLSAFRRVSGGVVVR
ncbi:unnamed protein product [Microthlaspi erraticum]|uniref:Uncharacterized protein n=1 Tax=Microthlaspi erraticum TaxID=1685480 RepID=A0A6D2JHU4_9BRAS|nr:unnamed protein product [Microthlaspi erraticum]